MRNFLHKILVFFCLLFTVGILLGYLCVYVSPETITFPALFGLAYPYLLCINIVFVLYWIYRKRWTFLLPLFIIILGWQTFSTYVAFGFNKTDLVTSEVKIMSYNARYFNKYNWNKDPETASNILEMIKYEKVDIVCFQEFLLGGAEAINISRIAASLSKFPYYYINNRKDLAIFSKFKIESTSEISFDNSSSASAFYTDVYIGREMVRIFNCHLESNRFKRKDYEFINNLRQNAEKKNIDGAMGITKRLKYAFRKRANQADVINELVKNTNHKSIVCIDMNDTPVSYTYRKSRGDLLDSFLEKGSGIGTTYIGDFPSYRIDYVFHHENLECSSFKIKKVKFSDHYPIIVGFRRDF